MIDLHCHSHFSDGELSPNALLEKAKASPIRVLALTDHDTIAGLPLLHEAAHQSDIKIINGIEFSVRWKKYDIHIIGLHFDADAPNLSALIKQQNDRRIARAQQIAERIEASGLQNVYEKACAIAGHERAGRLHFAQVLINEGLVANMKTAFKRYLGQRCSAYVPTNWLSIEEAVSGIEQAGGQAVIAHPLKYGLTRSKLHELIKAFKAANGVGLEVVSGEMSEVQANEMAGLCLRYELLASTGSDYHGDSLSRIALGHQRALPVNCIPIWHQWNI